MTEKRTVVKLFNKKEDCCGCSACEAICPNYAITMKRDEMGFFYPIIDEQKCISCLRCIGVCPLKA